MRANSPAPTYCAKCNAKIDFSYLRKSQYAWKIKSDYYCSYSCYSKVVNKKGGK